MLCSVLLPDNDKYHFEICNWKHLVDVQTECGDDSMLYLSEKFLQNILITVHVLHLMCTSSKHTL